jgi:hypothetical protein
MLDTEPIEKRGCATKLGRAAPIDRLPALWPFVSSGFCTNHPENHRGTESTEVAQRRPKRRQVARALMESCRCQRDLRSAGAGHSEESRPKSSPRCAYECVRRVPSFRWLLCAASVPSVPLWFSGGTVQNPVSSEPALTLSGRSLTSRSPGRSRRRAACGRRRAP